MPHVAMFDAVALFSTLAVIEAVERADQITRDAPDTLKLDAFTDCDFIAHFMPLSSLRRL